MMAIPNVAAMILLHRHIQVPGKKSIASPPR